MFVKPPLRGRTIIVNWRKNYLLKGIWQGTTTFVLDHILMPTLFTDSDIPADVKNNIQAKIASAIGVSPMMGPRMGPAYGAPAYGAPAPAYGAPAYGAPAPAYGAPAYGAPAPAYAAPQQPSLPPQMNQLAGMVRANRAVDINQAASVLGKDQGQVRQAIVELSKVGRVSGRFVSPTNYQISSDVERFMVDFNDQLGRTPVPAAKPAAPAMSDQEILKKLEKMFKASKRLKVEDVCNVLGVNRAQMLSKFFDWSDQFGFKIDGDYLVIGEETDFGSMLDKQFEEWHDKEETKQGKMADMSADDLDKQFKDWQQT
jgi:hypothetical protein